MNNFLSEDNINNVYKNIKDLIQARENYNIDESSKYRKTIVKMLTSIKEKYTKVNNINEFNNIATNKSIPFITDIIYKKRKKNKEVTPLMPYDLGDQNKLTPMNISGFNTDSQEPEFIKKMQEMDNERIEQLNKNRPNGDINKDLTYNPNINISNNIHNNDANDNLNIPKPNLSNLSYNPNVDINQKNFNPPTIPQNINYQSQSNNILPAPISIKKKIDIPNNIIIDTGTSDNNKVENLALKYWSRFKCSLSKSIEIEDKMYLYLENIVIIGATNDFTNNSCFLINIKELDEISTSNNAVFNNNIIIANTANNSILIQNLNQKVGKITPQTLSELTISITNENNKSIDNEDNNVFTNSNMRNRIIMEFSFQPI